MLVKKIFGLCFVALPFAVVFIGGVKTIGVAGTLIAFGLVALTVVIGALGLKFLAD